MTACSKENQEIIPNWLLNRGIKEPQCHRGVVLSISARMLRMMFALSSVGGSKSAEGGPYPLADLDRGAHIR